MKKDHAPNNSTSKASLATLAKKINQQHRAAEQALSEGVSHALEAGKLLLQAKTLIGHGGWGKWLKSNCKVTERTAQIYMKLARANPKRVSDLSLLDAISPERSDRSVVRSKAAIAGRCRNLLCQPACRPGMIAQVGSRIRVNPEEVCRALPRTPFRGSSVTSTVC